MGRILTISTSQIRLWRRCRVVWVITIHTLKWLPWITKIRWLLTRSLMPRAPRIPNAKSQSPALIDWELDQNIEAKVKESHGSQLRAEIPSKRPVLSIKRSPEFLKLIWFRIPTSTWVRLETAWFATKMIKGILLSWARSATSISTRKWENRKLSCLRKR